MLNLSEVFACSIWYLALLIKLYHLHQTLNEILILSQQILHWTDMCELYMFRTQIGNYCKWVPYKMCLLFCTLFQCFPMILGYHIDFWAGVLIKHPCNENDVPDKWFMDGYLKNDTNQDINTNLILSVYLLCAESFSSWNEKDQWFVFICHIGWYY